jgi:DNA mismatch repair protein MutS
LVNYNVSVKEVGNDIVFLHHLQPGGADRSYGIEVARLAGLPGEVIARARDILRELEGAHTSGGVGLGRQGRHRSDQLSLFHTADPAILERLRRLEVESITPIQALNVLSELKQMLMDAGKGR